MRVDIVEESHNRVDWQVRSPLLWIEAGLLMGALAVAGLLLFSPSPVRWQITGAITGLLVVLSAVLAVTTPSLDHGYLERLPEGGSLARARVWPLVGAKPVLEAELDGIRGFEMETEIFEESATESYKLSRLWAVAEGETRYCLTNWADTESVTALGTALAKAGRLAFEGAAA